LNDKIVTRSEERARGKIFCAPTGYRQWTRSKRLRNLSTARFGFAKWTTEQP
jgi:hypothetical protein